MSIQNRVGVARGELKSTKNERGGVPIQQGPVIGEVMDTHDPTYSGRIRVWIPQFGDASTKQLDSSWITVRYLSPFYGVTPHNKIDHPDPSFDNNGHAYGMWMTVPDVGVEVLCIFANGDTNQGFYVGFIPEPQMNQMIPAIGAKANPLYNNSTQESKLSRAPRVPVTEMDKKEESMEDAKYVDRQRPVHSVVAGQMFKAGTITDPVRGPIGSSASRESPSCVYGINTPGRPIYSSGLYDKNLKTALENETATKNDTKVQGRRGGHSFVMDDGDIEGSDNLIRLRTSTGHQITMSDDGAAVYICHASGKTWIELGNEGTVDVYSTNSINLRSHGEINIHADKDINFHSGRNINMYSKKRTKIEAETELHLTGKSEVKTYSKIKVDVRSDGTLALHCEAKGSWKSIGPTEIRGSTIGLNHGSAQSVIKPRGITQNFLPDAVEGNTGWESESAKLKTIVSRAPTHEPYPYHGSGVKVKVTFPRATSVAQETPSPTPATKKAAEIQSKPPESTVSVKEVVKEAVAGVETKAVESIPSEQVTGILADAASKMTAAVDNPLSAITELGIGKYGIPNELLQIGGYIKRGVDVVGKATNFLDDASIFTGKGGISSITNLLVNENLQSQIMQGAMSSTMKELKLGGIITGLESASELAGFAGAAMKALPTDIKDWVGGIASTDLTSLLDPVAKGAQFAATLVETKAMDLIGKVQSGIGGGNIQLPKISIGTVDFGNINADLTSFLGNVKIPSVGDFGSISDVTSQIAKFGSGVTDGLSAITLDSAIDTAKDLGIDLLEDAVGDIKTDLLKDISSKIGGIV